MFETLKNLGALIIFGLCVQVQRVSCRCCQWNLMAVAGVSLCKPLGSPEQAADSAKTPAIFSTLSPTFVCSHWKAVPEEMLSNMSIDVAAFLKRAQVLNCDHGRHFLLRPWCGWCTGNRIELDLFDTHDRDLIEWDFNDLHLTTKKANI